MVNLDDLSDAELAMGLMAGDPASFKAGYTPENAVLAVVDSRQLSETAAVELAKKVGADADVVSRVMQA